MSLSLFIVREDSGEATSDRLSAAAAGSSPGRAGGCCCCPVLPFFRPQSDSWLGEGPLKAQPINLPKVIAIFDECFTNICFYEIFQVSIYGYTLGFGSGG